jgi:hypothetical protein
MPPIGGSLVRGDQPMFGATYSTVGKRLPMAKSAVPPP